MDDRAVNQIQIVYCLTVKGEIPWFPWFHHQVPWFPSLLELLFQIPWFPESEGTLFKSEASLRTRGLPWVFPPTVPEWPPLHLPRHPTAPGERWPPHLRDLCIPLPSDLSLTSSSLPALNSWVFFGRCPSFHIRLSYGSSSVSVFPLLEHSFLQCHVVVCCSRRWRIAWFSLRFYMLRPSTWRFLRIIS